MDSEKEGNPFDDSQAMASNETKEPAPETAAAAAATPPAEDQEKAAATTSPLEPPSLGVNRSTTFPTRLRSPGRQDNEDAPAAVDGINRRRGQTFSSTRQSVEPDRLGSIQEDHPVRRQQDGGSIRSTRSPSNAGGLRDRSTSILSRRRPRGITLNRTPTLVRRPTAIASGMSLADGQDVPGGFTLAGPDSTQAAQNQPFVDPLYAQLNPAYVQPTNTRPVWGLAKPLPRVLRPGMVPAPSEMNFNRPDNTSETGSRGEYQSQPDIDVEQGIPSLRRAGTFQAVSGLRDQRENKLLLRRQGTLAAASEARTSTDDQAVKPIRSNEPFPTIPAYGAMPTPIQEEEREDFFGPLQHRYSYQPSADRVNAANAGDGASSETEVEDEDDWPALTPYDIKVGNPEDEVHNHHTHWSIIRTRYREPLAEFLAALVQLTIAFCADLSITVSNNDNNFSASFAWGFATMVGIYIAGGISGAHLNPAVSIMLWVYRGFPLRKVPTYIFAQVLAAFIAALISYGLYRSAIIEFSAGAGLGAGGTADSFLTSRRHTTVDAATAFFNEFVATAFLAVVVLALGDDSNAPPGAGMSALVLGLAITALCMAFGYNTGAAMNPSRDFGPRLALWAVGYGTGIWKNGFWAYGAWAATITGAVFGGGMYDIAIFVGGESPINYPRKRMWRAGHKFKKRMKKRLRREEIPDTLR